MGETSLNPERFLTSKSGDLLAKRFEVIRTPNPKALALAAAGFWVDRSHEAVARRGQFTVALTGGSGPVRLYQLLASPSWRERIEWTKTHFFWGDDRFVPMDDPESNFALANTTLLSALPLRPEQVHRIPTELRDPQAAADAYEAGLRRFFQLTTTGWPRFDLVLLGLATDGHIASLFPGSTTLEEAHRLVMAATPGLLPPKLDRVTMTLPVLNAARAVAFLVAGADKAAVVRQVLNGAVDLPATLVKPTDGELHWFVDAAAAGDGL